MTIRLTQNGVAKLMQLTGRFHETDVVVQVLFPSWPQWTQSAEERLFRLRGYFEVVVSDGFYYAPAIICVPYVDSHLVDCPAVIRVKKAIFCSPVGRP